MSMLTIMAAALDRELLSHGITGLDRDDCEEIVRRVMAQSAALAEAALRAKATETLEPRH